MKLKKKLTQKKFFFICNLSKHIHYLSEEIVFYKYFYIKC